MMNRIWNDEQGVLTFEWILLITLLVIGLVGGLATVRDALNIELAETAGAIGALSQGYGILEAPTIIIAAEAAGDVTYGAFTEDVADGSVFTDAPIVISLAAGTTPTP